MTKKLLLSGYYGFDNSGDDAILKSIVDKIREKNLDYDLTALAKDSAKIEKNYNIKAVDRFSPREVFRAMKETDVFVFGGGSLLQDVTSSRSLYYYLALIRIAKFYKKKVFVFANGIGPINKKFNRRLTKKYLDKVDFITLRDNESFKYMRNLGVSNENVEVTADPVFLMNSSSDERALEILEEKNIKLSKNTIGISVREWQKSPDLNVEISKFLDYLAGEDVDILLIPMHYPYDVGFSATIKENTKNERVYILDTKYEVEDIIAVMKRCKIIFAMRLHSLIYAAKAQVPMVGLVYDPKVTGLIRELDVSEFINVEDVTEELLREKYASCLSNLSERKKSIEIANKRQEILSEKTIELLEEVINRE